MIISFKSQFSSNLHSFLSQLSLIMVFRHLALLSLAIALQSILAIPAANEASPGEVKYLQKNNNKIILREEKLRRGLETLSHYRDTGKTLIQSLSCIDPS